MSKPAAYKSAFADYGERARTRLVVFLDAKLWRKYLKQVKVALASIGSASFSLKEQTLFMKRLAFLSNAGVPIVEALQVLRDQTKGKGHGVILDHIVKDVSNGQSLSKSMGKFSKIFNEFSIQIIKVGESSGTLFQNLEYLADELKKRQALRRKVVGAFIYPALISFATIGITVFLMVYLFPKITPVFTSLHATLPLSTRIVIAISNALRDYGVLIFLALAAAITAIVVTVRKNNQAHTYFDYGLLKLPFVGNMIRSYNIANASRTLGLLLKSGARLSVALAVTGDTTTNLVYKQMYKDLEVVVTRGDKISTQLAKRPDLYPDIVSHMVAVGERSGTLSDTLVYLSELYDAEVEDFTKNLSTLIEPVLMVVMGLMVGFIAISIITPIYGITQNLHA